MKFSIINERKNQSNFQLIIITHDENFLRKLGQSDVMDYYWCALCLSLINCLYPVLPLGAFREIQDKSLSSNGKDSDEIFVILK
jgi:hypothetical protein